MLEEKACQYYQHEWVLTKEEELRKQENAGTDKEDDETHSSCPQVKISGV